MDSESPWLEDAYYRALCNTMILLRQKKMATEERQARSRSSRHGRHKDLIGSSPFAALPRATPQEIDATHNVLMDLETLWRRELKRVVAKRRQQGWGFITTSASSPSIKETVNNSDSIPNNRHHPQQQEEEALPSAGSEELIQRKIKSSGEDEEEKIASSGQRSCAVVYHHVRQCAPALSWFSSLPEPAQLFLQKCQYNPPPPPPKEIQESPPQVNRPVESIVANLLHSSIRRRLTTAPPPPSFGGVAMLSSMTYNEASLNANTTPTLDDATEIILEGDEEADAEALRGATWDPDGLCTTVRNILACSGKHGKLPRRLGGRDDNGAAAAVVRFSNALLHIGDKGEIAVARVMLRLGLQGAPPS